MRNLPRDLWLHRATFRLGRITGRTQAYGETVMLIYSGFIVAALVLGTIGWLKRLAGI